MTANQEKIAIYIYACDHNLIWSETMLIKVGQEREKYIYVQIADKFLTKVKQSHIYKTQSFYNKDVL